MVTIATVRDQVRVRLEDPDAGLWEDATLDEVIAETLAEYNALLPRESVLALPVAGGDLDVSLPDSVVAIQRVVLPDGTVPVARGQPAGPVSGERQAWERFGGKLRFARPLVAGTLTVWALAGVEIEDVPARDVWLLVLGAVWRALARRGVQEWKRGVPQGRTDTLTVDRAREEYQAALRARRRRAKTVYLVPS